MSVEAVQAVTIQYVSTPDKVEPQKTPDKKVEVPIQPVQESNPYNQEPQDRNAAKRLFDLVA